MKLEEYLNKLKKSSFIERSLCVSNKWINVVVYVRYYGKPKTDCYELTQDNYKTIKIPKKTLQLEIRNIFKSFESRYISVMFKSEVHDLDCLCDECEEKNFNSFRKEKNS